MNSQSIAQELQGLNDLVVAARGIISSGRVIDLDPVQKEVERICDDIKKLPPREGENLKPALVSLIDDLGRLTEDMQTCHAELKSQLENLTSHSTVAAAYAKGQSKRK